jgi:hypothetical protein
MAISFLRFEFMVYGARWILKLKVAGVKNLPLQSIA